MVKKLLVLLMLITALVICEQESVVVQADACDNCNNTYSNCIGAAAQTFSTCTDSVLEFWVNCISDCYPYWVCEENAANLDNACWGAYTGASTSCDNAHTSCLQSDCGGSGGGGHSTTCGDGVHGYSDICVAAAKGQRDVCLSEGCEGDDAVCQQCMTNGGSQAECCNAQADYDIQVNCVCNIDPRNPNCRACYGL